MKNQRKQPDLQSSAEQANAETKPLTFHPTLNKIPHKFALITILKSALRNVFARFGFHISLKRPRLDDARIWKELEDLRAFRLAAEAEIVTLKDRTLADADQLKVQTDYLAALISVVDSQDQQLLAHPRVIVTPGHGDVDLEKNEPQSLDSTEPYPSCAWIEGGLSFVPGHVRVCPNSHLHGGTPGLFDFREGPLPVDAILQRKEIIRRANRLDCFDPCRNCAYRTAQAWPRKTYAFDLLCISHATACNLACSYCHTIPEERYLQNPNIVPRIYPTIEALIKEGYLAPGARIQWGGGEPTILKEFTALFRLLEQHGANSEVFSSGVRLSEVVLEGLMRNTAGIMVSLDAGNAETYNRIKGRPVFERVISNVKRYANANPGRTILKMILNEENMAEVVQFMDVAEQSGVRMVCFDTPMYRNHIDKRLIEAASLFQAEAARRGLECHIGEVGSVYNPADRVRDRVTDLSTASL